MNKTSSAAGLPNAAAVRVELLEDVVRSLLRDVVPHVRDTGHNAADREMYETIMSARAAVPEPGKDASVSWPAAAGWYWAYGRIAGMREAALMSARALVEGDKLIVYVGEAMTHRLSAPDPELPLQFKPAVLPMF
jgi:hypothetical protein